MKIVPNRVISCFLLFANGVLYAQGGPPPPPPPPPPQTPINDFVTILFLGGIFFAYFKFKSIQKKSSNLN